MQITQRLNNNVVLVEGESGQPMIVMGKGVGYKAYPGNLIDESLIERKFILKNEPKSEIDKVSALISEIPLPFITLSDTILKLAEKELHTEFGLTMLISLTDHIFSAVERKKQGMSIVSPLHWDIKQLYPLEYALGEKAVAAINEVVDVELDETESTAIAMHFISSGNNYDSIQQAMNVTKIISEIISIIQYHFQIKIDQNSINFSRLVSHLQYFLIRQVKGIKMMDMSEEMIRIVIDQYKSSFQCAEKIIRYLNNNHNVKPPLEEEVYLTMHIERVRQIEM
ncbi:beta-glucoside operon transcriptional antiterminator [Enterococcus sp. AZ135]|uniref:PRD domain-containing protein n=1 Tax=unclassified Enterococcus TaxID=2608891 RepID=UPI003F24A9E4